MTKIVLISGVSRSGKSTLAQKLCKDLSNAVILHQDKFVLPADQLPYIKDQIDWERPETIDWKTLKKGISESQSSKEYIIIEGIFTLTDLDIISTAAYIISLEIDKHTFTERRKRETRWGNEPEWFLEHVWKSHLKFHNPHKVTRNMILDNLDAIDYTFLLNQIRLL